MRCPSCLAEDTQVKDSRPSEDKASIRRRRYCTECNYRFTTIERVQLKELIVVKKNGDKKPFDRDKLTRSILTATRKRSIPKEIVETMVNSIVLKLESSIETDIPSSSIGEAIMNELSKIDQVAYVRFASVYKDFNTVDDFKNFIRQTANKDIN